jgi:two-component system sensor histidine kinase/response regulator
VRASLAPVHAACVDPLGTTESGDRSRAAVPSNASGMPASRAKSFVLVVDDTDANRALARATLEAEGHEVAVASNGADALRQFAERAPDCVVLDVRMPDIDGLEVCRRMRALENGRATPIVFCTALRDVDVFDEALAAGGNDFVTKPVRPTELAVRVQTALALGRVAAENRAYVELARRQRDELVRLQLQKERLTEFLVHDLKNPVNAMDLHAQLILRDRSCSPAARDSATRIRDDVRSLLRLILDLLDLSKGDEGSLALLRTEIDLAPFIEEIRGSFEARGSARHLQIAASVAPGVVRADASLLRRVVENLLENALRYAPERSTVGIAASLRDGALEVRVSDEGAGVPDDLRDRIFERFVQVEAGDHRAERTGRGLGLAFSKLAVEAHGGRIWVEGADPGATFVFRIPASA